MTKIIKHIKEFGFFGWMQIFAVLMFLYIVLLAVLSKSS